MEIINLEEKLNKQTEEFNKYKEENNKLITNLIDQINQLKQNSGK